MYVHVVYGSGKDGKPIVVGHILADATKGKAVGAILKPGDKNDFRDALYILNERMNRLRDLCSPVKMPLCTRKVKDVAGNMMTATELMNANVPIAFTADQAESVESAWRDAKLSALDGQSDILDDTKPFSSPYKIVYEV